MIGFGLSFRHLGLAVPRPDAAVTFLAGLGYALGRGFSIRSRTLTWCFVRTRKCRRWRSSIPAMHQGRSTNTWRGRQAALSITPVSKPAICAPALPRSRQPICVRFACCRSRPAGSVWRPLRVVLRRRRHRIDRNPRIGVQSVAAAIKRGLTKRSSLPACSCSCDQSSKAKSMTTRPDVGSFSVRRSRALDVARADQLQRQIVQAGIVADDEERADVAAFRGSVRRAFGAGIVDAVVVDDRAASCATPRRRAPRFLRPASPAIPGRGRERGRGGQVGADDRRVGAAALRQFAVAVALAGLGALGFGMA